MVISDSELSNLSALRQRFHSLEDARAKALAQSLFRSEVLEDFRRNGTDEVAERKERTPRAPKLDTQGSMRDYLYNLSESLGIGAELPPSSVELTLKLIERQIETYEDEILAMRTDAKYLWEKMSEDLSNGPSTALFTYFVTADEEPSAEAPKRMLEFSFFHSRAFKSRVYHAYHFLSVWTYIGKAFKELKSLGYTTRSAEQDILRKPKIRNLILQIKEVCLQELCQDLSHYFRRALASSARYGRFFDVEWDGSVAVNKGIYLTEVKVTVKPEAFQEALPGLEASLLRLCDPDSIWESTECFRIIDGYTRCPTVPNIYLTERISELLSEYASLTMFMDFLLRPFKAPLIQELFRNSQISSPPRLQSPGWDTSWTGMLYGGEPIYRIELSRLILQKLINKEGTDWLPTLWQKIDNAYLVNTSKSINDFWEVAGFAEKPPQWHDDRDLVNEPYVPPSVMSTSERVQSSHSYLKSSMPSTSSVKQKSRATMPGGYVSTIDSDDSDLEDGPAPPPQYNHAVYELPRKTLKILHRLLRDRIDGVQESEGKVTWKDTCKVFRALNFTIDESTPGSAVNFIPPSSKDRPITIHRPHPHPELNPLRVRQIGARLRRVYGWSEDWFRVAKMAE
ncbi:hypothetical protein B0H10DRAFT_1978327 [Mycena sp. CBHHK59/15]|nr:hypothetical protein B0H10DRAFT_1978327 [Mycena sp. CBHHK59/15]